MSPMNFLGDSQHQGLASTQVTQCLTCKQPLRCHTSKMVACNEENHYATNVGAMLTQIATGGGSSQLEEQLSCVTVTALSKKSFMHLECSLGTLFEATVSQQLLSAGKQEMQGGHRGHISIPTMLRVVWVSYLVLQPKKLLFIGVRNKYCSVCAVSKHHNLPTPSHQCFKVLLVLWRVT